MEKNRYNRNREITARRRAVANELGSVLDLEKNRETINQIISDAKLRLVTKDLGAGAHSELDEVLNFIAECQALDAQLVAAKRKIVDAIASTLDSKLPLTEVLLSHYILGKTIEEIAAEQNVSRATAYRRYQEGLDAVAPYILPQSSTDGIIQQSILL